MFSQLNQLQQQVVTELAKVQTLADLELVETALFSRQNGSLTAVMKAIKDVVPAEKKAYGEASNALKAELEGLVASKRAALELARYSTLATDEQIDVTQPLLPKASKGHIHPVSQVQSELEDLFAAMGFVVLDGPELESDYYNFTALNIPPDHPARDMQDTFYIKDHANWVMRTQTSSMQVRALQKYGAPLRAIIPGRCFRNEATDPRHEHTFYQLEGIVVDKKINFAHMKGVFQAVADHLFGVGTQIRLMPKFYPFVEPGVRGEVSCFICQGKGCRVCKQTGWLEAMPGGLIHPNVLRESGLDPNEYSGFAFGFGLTRLAMLKYGIEDVRLLQSGDLRFLQQF